MRNCQVCGAEVKSRGYWDSVLKFTMCAKCWAIGFEDNPMTKRVRRLELEIEKLKQK